MSFSLNNDYFNKQILPSFGQAQFTDVVLDC
jgi:hypothetical protein